MVDLLRSKADRSSDVWDLEVRLLGLAMNISVQSIMHIMLLLKLHLNIFGIFLSIAPLVGHLMSGLRTRAIAGTQLLKTFDMVVFNTQNL